MSKPIIIESNFGIESKKNAHPVVIHEEHIYWWKNTNKDGSQKFYCSQRNQYKCTATIKLIGTDVVSNPFKSLKQCYNTAQSNLVRKELTDESIATNFPTYHKISNCLKKRKANNRPKETTDFSTLEISGEYAMTHGQKEFLRYDNKSPTKRLIIFVDDKSLKILGESTFWYMDRTFKCAPKKLMQLFSIHAQLENVTISCVFILSQQRDEEVYREAFGINLNPHTAMSDFELASRSAIKFHFPNNYTSTNYRKYINSLEALALVPVNSVVEGFNFIKNIMPYGPKCLELYNYFNGQWIKKTPLTDWNHFASDIRTNNKVEGFHSGFNRLIMSSHPNTFLLINFLKDFQVTSVIDYERLNQGQFIQINLKKDTLKHQSIEFIKSKFTDSSNIDQYLSSLIQFVEYPHEYWQDEQDLGLYYEQEDEFEDQQEVMTCPALSKAQNTPSIENEPENVMSFVTNSDHAISEIISQAIALLHENFYLPPSNVHINRRVPLMEQLGTDFNEDSSSSVFDYIKENE
ncbi:unnamed protein product [Brachionus calyciflorus]|uniref:FLYWCH-type domain-containing protein n=1 Tax=Brachionus calyciflorus TaxID=104777 RepID=A0A813U3K4_9BILA|nr:unnamed protein product [Brachionus calyciflorus]